MQSARGRAKRAVLFDVEPIRDDALRAELRSLLGEDRAADDELARRRASDKPGARPIVTGREVSGGGPGRGKRPETTQPW
jgi:hypothetical protein